MNENSGQHPYSMTIDLNVLNHLGIGLYSSTPAVLSEVVANSWDADAREVTIDIRPEEDEIEIRDDGVGMTQGEVNDKYLRVGYRKRQVEKVVTGLGRHVMGRKGIGKLSVFSIARFVEVHTVKDGKRSGLLMDRDAIKEMMGSTGAVTYHPKPIPSSSIAIDRGTRILLRNLDKRLTSTDTHLRRRLARRFSVIGRRFQFAVLVGGVQITPSDRDFYSKLEFVWHLGEENSEVLEHAKSLEGEVVSGDVGTLNLKDGDCETLRATGWIGTVDRPESIDKTNNAVVVLSHGKLVHENLLPDFREAGVYADYVIGEINADFLDADNRDDIVTSGRQSLKEDDRRFELLVDYVGRLLKDIKRKWTDLRRKYGTKSALQNPVLKEWFESLTKDRRRTAEALFGKIEALRLGDQVAKVEIYRSGLLAFEKLALQDALSALVDLESESDFRALTRVSRSVDDVEAALYHDIVRGRLEVVRKFSELKAESLEKVLQQYIFDHLWLLDASWERAATNLHIEEAVSTEFKNVSLSDEEKRGRIDIRYRTAAGKHIIIELKKYSARVPATRLAEQVRKYKRALEKCLREKFPNEPADIEIICLVGSAPSPKDDPKGNRDILRAVGARWYTYDSLLQDVKARYREFLEEERKVKSLAQLLDRLERSFPA